MRGINSRDALENPLLVYHLSGTLTFVPSWTEQLQLKVNCGTNARVANHLVFDAPIRGIAYTARA